MAFSTKDMCVCLCVDGVQHQGHVCLPVCGWCSAPRTGVFACVWIVFSTKDRCVCVRMVFSSKDSTKDMCVCLCVDGVQHQGQVCLPVCGWCSAPRTGVFACVWMVFSTKDRCVCLCVDGVQHQGHVCLCVDGVQHQGQVCLPVCGWCSAPRIGVFACVWMVFSTKDRCVCLCVDGVQHQGQLLKDASYSDNSNKDAERSPQLSGKRVPTGDILTRLKGKSLLHMQQRYSMWLSTRIYTGEGGQSVIALNVNIIVKVRWQDTMGRMLRHVLIFLLIILKEPYTPEAGCSCSISTFCQIRPLWFTRRTPCCNCDGQNLTGIPPDLPENIAFLYLGNNKITSFPKNIPKSIGTFTNLPKLEYLDLEANRLSVLPPFAHGMLPAGIRKIICFEKNPWQCDCRMRPFRWKMTGSAATSPYVKTNAGSTAYPVASKSATQLTFTNLTVLVDRFESANNLYNGTANGTSPYNETNVESTPRPADITRAPLTTSAPLAITSDISQESVPRFLLPAIIGSTFGPIPGIVLIGSIFLIIRWRKRHPPSGQNSNATSTNVCTTATVMTSGHDQTGQGQSRANTNTNTTAVVIETDDDHQYEDIDNRRRVKTKPGQSLAITKPNTNTTATVLTSDDDHYYEDVDNRRRVKTRQGQSQANTNTTATVMASGDDHQYEDIDKPRVKTGQGQSLKVGNLSHGKILAALDPNPMYVSTNEASDHDQTGQGQSQTITKPNTNTKATEMSSDDDQTGQGQFQASIPPLKVVNLSHEEILAALNPNPMYVSTKVGSSHDQTGQGQSQANTEFNTNTTITVVTSDHYYQYEDMNQHNQAGKGQYQAITGTESTTNTTATAIMSGHDQTKQSQATTPHLDVINLTYNTSLDVSQPNSMYTGVESAPNNPESRGLRQFANRGAIEATAESLDVRNLTYDTGMSVSQPNSLYTGMESPQI
ncbi:corticospinal neuron axon guidance through spinal cord [Branchiostoma belcheri]|nr:corticospinal neuron axon guidance through spinal cord [Branchiostoma belcheri]